MYELRKYQNSEGQVPFDDWLNGLRDQRAKMRILVRLRRVCLGLFGDCKAVGDGVSELRISEGKGYRVYFAIHADVAMLLCGGSKASQSGDIERAKAYWAEQKSR